MIQQLLLGAALICLSVILIVAFFSTATSTIKRIEGWLDRGHKAIRMIVALSGVVLWLLAALSLAVWIWAIAFLWIGEFSSMEEAVYFSLTSFTTLGAVGVSMTENWRLLSGILAANGFLLFSLATAFLIELLGRIRVAQRH